MKIKSYLPALAVVVTLVSCGGDKRQSMGDTEFPVAVIGSANTVLQSTYPAAIKGIQDVEVRPKISGFITKVLVQEGQAVKAGQLLFTIDSETYCAAVRQAQAAVNTAKAQLNTAKMTYENNKSLFEKNIIGQYELSTAQNAYATAQAAVAQTEAALASARETLAWCNVTSPATGTVGSLPYKVGTLVSASNALTTVSDVSTVEVFFSMSESELLGMTKTAGNAASAVSMIPPVKLMLADGTVYNHPGKVVKMSGVIDPTTGTTSLIAHFSNPEHLLKSGGAGKIIVPQADNNAILVPQDAISEVQNKRFVYIVGNENKVKYSEISVNPQNDGKNYIVTSGLKVGDKIVIKGITKLTDGMEITPITLQQYEEKIKKAEEMGKAQGDVGEFVKAMQGK